MEIENYALIFLNLLPIEKKMQLSLLSPCQLYTHTHIHRVLHAYEHMQT